MLNRNNALLIFIDVQGKLHEIMPERATLDANLERMITCTKLLKLPLLVTEQLPDKLGPTNEPFRTQLAGATVLRKSAFSCCGEVSFRTALRATEKNQVILVGIETHVCVYQTALDLLADNFEVLWWRMPLPRETPKTKRWHCKRYAMQVPKFSPPKPCSLLYCATPPTRFLNRF
jgi:hypothetical protein